MGGLFRLGRSNAKSGKEPTSASENCLPNADMGSRFKDNPNQYVCDEFCRMVFDGHIVHGHDIVARRLTRAEMLLNVALRVWLVVGNLMTTKN
ncbi:hypothetical protein PF002_g30338 [Phytophthora fragariae]|uniref:Uncharacterized protein n=1 Tax=Phytophthora fragariae TaxID=53985 RepID=A0A6A3Q4W3_9STRA|nr:hypothetical protein PF003_g35345 [Phytophthora fragariae]KAE8919415.1 hypothetical protein PF009_g30279 [Phytophthora fragariae]KAE8963052.1 hypothetical protein PF011_g29170 [Phytophthora fragariae]KAE9068759.1 hypothetical protein PF006_g29726 [Phytophthora fragariae]KAE9169510.1 hypothetical protein PF002_g30338 [Phytophthora fragariae]